MKRLLSCAALLLAVCGLWTAPALAAAPTLTAAGGATFPNRAFLLTFPAGVSLTPGAVSVTENGGSVTGLSVLAANAVGQSHFGTVLLIDASGSMAGAAIDSAMNAARTFAHYRNPHQPLGVVFFNASSTVALPLTADSAAIAKALAQPPALGRYTHIYDAAGIAIAMLQRANISAGSIVLLSDGGESGSRLSQAAVARLAQTQHVRVYTVGVQDPSYSGSTLQSLAHAAGGQYTAVGSQGLVPLYRELSAELSNQYLIRYTSTSALGRQVRVVASAAGLGSAAATYTAPPVPPAVPVVAAPHHTAFWDSSLGTLVVSALAALLFGIAVAALLAPRRSVSARVSQFVSVTQVVEPRKSSTSMFERMLGERQRTRLRQSDRWKAFVEDVEIARVGMSAPQILGLALVGTILVAWLLVTVTSSVFGVVLAGVVPLSVRAGISILAGRERKAFDEQLPDNLQVVASAMRAGHTFTGALAVVVEDAPEPSRRELRRVLAQEAIGVPMADALRRVSERMQSVDFEHVALVASLQRETGGNTAEVIDRVTETIRDRLDLRRLVGSLTAQGRLAGWIVSMLPVGLLVVISLINPHYMHPMFHRAAGIVMLSIATAMVLAGTYFIRRIVDIKI
jgi:tight adherence protein B